MDIREENGIYSKCTLCPRNCGADRTSKEGGGFCASPSSASVAKTMLHRFEEPPISGKNGSGAVFFTGCTLRCVFCQNAPIRDARAGKTEDADGLCADFERLLKLGAHNLNLVTATQYTPTVIRALDRLAERQKLPIVVWNSGGYEKKETIAMLERYVGVYLPDLKYYSPAISGRYSSAPDYFEFAIEAIAEMVGQRGEYREKNGICESGVIVRHLVLPGCRKDSIELLDRLAAKVDIKKIRLSLMRQYTPDFAPASCPELNRRVTSFEYESVLDEARRLGYEGFSQEASSATAVYTPEFGQVES